MDLEIRRNKLILSATDELEVAFLEDTLGLVNHGDSVKLVRINNSSKFRFKLVATKDSTLACESNVSLPCDNCKRYQYTSNQCSLIPVSRDSCISGGYRCYKERV